MGSTWGLLSVLSTRIKMKFFVVLSLIGCSFAAPVAEAEADADAQVLAYGHGLGLGHGLVGGVYSAGHAIAAPAVAHHAYAAPAVAHAAPVVAHHAYAAPAVAHATYAHVAPVAVATAPVVHQVGVQVHHRVHHVPQVSVQRHTS